MDIELELSDYFESRIFSNKTKIWLKDKLTHYLNESKEVMLEHYYNGFGKYLNATEISWPLYLLQFKSIDEFLNYPSGNMLSMAKMPERYKDLLELDLLGYTDSLRKEAYLIYKKHTTEENFNFLWNFITLSSSYNVETLLGKEILANSLEDFLGEIPEYHATEHWNLLRSFINQIKNKENLVITFSFHSFTIQVTGENIIEESVINNLKRAREYQVGITIRHLTNMKYDEVVCYKRMAAALISGDNFLEEIEPARLKKLYEQDPMTQDALGINSEDCIFMNFSDILKLFKINL